jgi:hypothetical protein
MEAVRVDALLGGDVIDAVVDHQRRLERVEQHLRLRHVGPQDRPPDAQSARGSAHERRQQPPVERAHRPVAVKGQHQRREDVEAVHGPWWGKAAPQPPPHAGQVTPRQLRLAQAEGLDEQHAILPREA